MSRATITICLACVALCTAACVALAVTAAVRAAEADKSAQTVDYLRREWPNMDAAVQEHEQALETLRTEVKELRATVAALQPAAHPTAQEQ